MEAIRLVLRYAHLIGFALLFGGFVAQYLSGKLKISALMLWGSAIQLVTGLLLAAPLRGGGDAEPPAAKLGVKAALAILLVIMVWVPRRKESVNRGHFLAIGVFTLITAAVGTFWR